MHPVHASGLRHMVLLSSCCVGDDVRMGGLRELHGVLRLRSCC